MPEPGSASSAPRALWSRNLLDIQPAPLSALDEDAGYRRSFMDRDLWKPYLEFVCKRHFSSTISTLRPGLAGSYPTFIVNDRWVIKFFGVLFEGGPSFEVERIVNHLVAFDPYIPAPALLAEGCLFPEENVWSWPYLVFEYLPGLSLGQLTQQLPPEQRIPIARQVGVIVRRLHALPLPSQNTFPQGCTDYDAFIQMQYTGCKDLHRISADLPTHMVDQIESFLMPSSEFVQTAPKLVLIHADLTRDHLLGRVDGDRWITSGLIDFGDAMPGELAYELVALHLDLFGCDKRLLSAFLDSYGYPVSLRTGLFFRAMSAALLHRFPVFVTLKGSIPALQEVPTLQEFSSYLWDPDYPEFQFSPA